MSIKTAFTTGPFLSASFLLEDFATGLYFSALLKEAVAEQIILERQLKEAQAEADEEKIARIETDLALIEGAYHLSSFVEGETTH